MRIAVSAGHNIYINNIFDPGATRNPYVEADITKETVKILIPLLKSQGHEVLDVTPYNQKFTYKKEHHELRGRKVNEFKPDLFLDIHINAGGGTGVETWVYSNASKSYPYANKIADSISKSIGMPNRGVKINPSYYSLSLNNYPSIIVEGGFIDNKTDMEKLTPRNYAESIAKVFGEIKEPESTVDKNSSNILYKVQVGAYTVKANAEKLLKDLADKGFKGFIKEEVADIKVIPSKEKKSKYYKKGDTHIIETTPDNIEIDILGNTLHGANRYGVNGTFFDINTAPVGSPESCVFIAVNEGKPLSNNAQYNGWNGPKRATLIYHTNKKLGFRQLQSINTIKDNTIWAIGGYMVKPYIDFGNERIPDSINYKTAHTYIGYDAEDKIYLIVKPNHMIYEIVPLLNELGITNAIVLDGGGSSQLNHKEGGYKSSRKINTAILLKEV